MLFYLVLYVHVWSHFLFRDKIETVRLYHAGLSVCSYYRYLCMAHVVAWGVPGTYTHGSELRWVGEQLMPFCFMSDRGRWCYACPVKTMPCVLRLIETMVLCFLRKNKQGCARVGSKPGGSSRAISKPPGCLQVLLIVERTTDRPPGCL